MQIGIVGAGVMGQGIAERFSTFGWEVVLVDKDEQILKQAKEKIERSLRLKQMFQKGMDIKEIIDHILFTTDYRNLSEVLYVIENVTESKTLKKQVYENLREICKQECIFMVNTSCIPISWIGNISGRSENVIGVHFMNPAPVKNFAEVIEGMLTSEETKEKVVTLLKMINIEVEIVHDSPGFVSNRLSHLFMNEAAFLVYENIATPEQVDKIFEAGFGHAMGPLKTADLIGLDTVLDSLKVLYEEYEDPKFRACPYLKQLVSVNHTGRKVGKGFYNYY